MVVWSGLGYLIFIALFAVLIIGQMLVGDTWSTDKAAQAIGIVIAGVVTLIIDKLFISKRKDTNYIHQDTGDVKTLRAHDTFFFLPFRFWPFLLMIGGGIYYLFGSGIL